MDPWSLLLLYLTVPGGRGLGLGRESNLKLEIAYFKNGKKGLGVDETFLPLGLGFEEIENKKKNGFLRISGL